MRVDIEELHKAKAVLNKINKEDIADIEFFEDGKKIEIPQKCLDEWQFIGLNNVDFIVTDFYLGSGI